MKLLRGLKKPKVPPPLVGLKVVPVVIGSLRLPASIPISGSVMLLARATAQTKITRPVESSTLFSNIAASRKRYIVSQ
jgi:hypothetical protein